MRGGRKILHRRKNSLETPKPTMRRLRTRGALRIWLSGRRASHTLRSNGNSETLIAQTEEALLLPSKVMVSVYDGGDASYQPHRDGQPAPSWRDLVQCAKEVVGQTSTMGWRAGAHAMSLSYQRFRSEQNHRAYTAILYLNPPPGNADPDSVLNIHGAWEWPVASVGGALRCHVDAAPDDFTGTTANDIMDIAPSGGRCVVFPSRETLHSVQPTKARRLAMTAWIFSDSILEDPEMSDRCVGTPMIA